MSEKLDLAMFLKAMRPIKLVRTKDLPHRGYGTNNTYVFFLKMSGEDEIEKLGEVLRRWETYMPDENKIRKMSKFPNYLMITAVERPYRNSNGTSGKHVNIRVETTFLRGMKPKKKDPIARKINEAACAGNIVSFSKFTETVEKNLHGLRGQFIGQDLGVI